MHGGSKRSVLLFLFICCWGLRADAKQLAVIVGKSNAVTAVSTADLSKIFTLDSRKWPDGNGVILVIMDPSLPEMQNAIQKIFKMGSDEFKIWMASHQRAVMVAKTDAELLTAVDTVPGAIGLIDVYSITNRIKVVKIDGKLPLEAGYLLRGN